MSCYNSNNYTGRGGCMPGECGGTYVTVRGPMGPMGPEGPRGEQGVPGPQGERGEQGIQGEKGETGERGEQGEPGETPEITVAEETPLVYRVRFRSAEEEFLSPNLRAVPEEYHVDISATNSVLTIPLGHLTLTYQTTSSTSVKISVAPKDPAVPVLADMRRTTIYGGGTIEVQTNDNTTVSGSIVLDTLMYSRSEEEHSMKIRQKDPETGLWSLCEIRSFISANGARTSVWVQWVESGVSYTTTSG